MADMYRGLRAASTRIREPKQRVIKFGPFEAGLVTSRPPELLGKGECYEMTNLVIGPDNIPKTRPGLSLHYAVSLASDSIDQVGDVKVNGIWYSICSTTYTSGGTTTYRLFKKNGTSSTQIGNDTMFEGPISFVGFNDLLIIFDGTYGKFWDGTTVSLLQDLGIGPKATYLVKNLNGELDITSPAIYNNIGLVSDSATNAQYSKVAVDFTTPDINTNFDVPTISFSIKMARHGDGTTSAGTYVKAVIRDITNVIVAEKNLVLPEDLPMITFAGDETPIDEFEVVSGSFLPSEATLTPLTPYWLSFEFSAGSDATNDHPLLAYNGDTNEYSSWYRYSNKLAAWVLGSLDGNFCLTVDVYCGTPPEITHGIVHESRLFGYTSEAPGKLWYSGAGNHLDWSSPNSGGYLETGREIGGLVSFYDSVWIFGTENTPSLMRLTGGQPAEYQLSDSIQAISSHQKAISAAPDDILFLHKAGVGSINTMQAFGDIRTNNRSDSIEDLIIDHADTTAFSTYEPTSGLYLLKLNDGADDTIYVFHTKAGKKRFPVAKWKYVLPNIEGGTQDITTMGQGQGNVYIATIDIDEGYIYKVDYDTLQDLSGGYPTYSLKSRYFFNRHVNMTAFSFGANVRVDAGATTAPTVKLKFYKNFSLTSFHEKTIRLPDSDDRDLVEPDSNSIFLRGFARERLNFDFWALQVAYEEISPFSDVNIYFGDIEILAG